MPSATPPRPGAASTDVRRRVANPWAVDLRELGRRAGSMKKLDTTLPAPAGWVVELIGVPAGGEVAVRLRLEAVMEGVLVSGDVEVPVVGQCARCLEPLTDRFDIAVQELFAYAGSTTEATSDQDEIRRIEGDFLDLEPMLRDAVVLALPLAPVCTPGCAGLCVDCGQRLDDLPAGHSHELLDPRWAGLAARLAATPDNPPPTTARGALPESQPAGRHHPPEEN